MNKKKIINDPIYGFITIPNELIFDIIEHPYFQRLRRIRQLGVSDLIYPGATHTRFHHALGSMHLMGEVLNNLRDKGHEISDDEFQGALIAILLHDIGHGPFSHSLEFGLFPEIAHEELSLILIRKINEQFGGALNLAIQIFTGQYERKFLNQLVSSQLDIDRLDYLRRDSFFTGVQEGNIGAERIITMLNLKNDELVVEEKGIYSVENFLNARRLMYWQVYLHKAAVSADTMLMELIRRAKFLMNDGQELQASRALSHFLEGSFTADTFEASDRSIYMFNRLDDTDIIGSMKFWLDSEDFVLRFLSKHWLDRQLFRVIISQDVPEDKMIEELNDRAKGKYGLSSKEISHLVKSGTVSNSAYLPKDQTINILKKSGEVIDVAQATDLPNIKAISKIVKKHYLCYPKELDLQPE